MFQKNKLHMACQLAFVAMLATSSSAFAQQAQEEGADESVEVIEVTGFRSSIAKSIDRKRESKNVVDAIIAEDMGKMPDENIAEALQRVTGVSITRDFGEGGSVSVRGMGADLNQITVNGQTLTSGGDGRGVSFTSMSADLLSAIEVVKTPSANHDEGSIGGSVNLKTLRPLTGSKERMGAEIKYSQNDLAEKDDPSGNFSVVRHLSDKVGVMANVSFEQRNARQDQVKSRGWDTFDLTDPVYNIAPDTAAADADGLGFVPRAIDHVLDINKRTRLGGAFNIEYKPSDEAKFHLDITVTQLDSEKEFYSNGNGNSQTTNARRAERWGLQNAVVDEYGTLLYGEFAGITEKNGNYSLGSQTFRVDDYADIRTRNVTVGLGGEITLTDSLEVSVETGTSIAEEKYLEARRFNFQDARHTHAINLDPTSAIPVYSQLADTSLPYLANSGNDIDLSQVRDNQRDVEDQNMFAQVDFDFMLDSNHISSVAFGAKVTDRHKQRFAQDTMIQPRNLKFSDNVQTIYLATTDAEGVESYEKFGTKISRELAAEGAPAFPVDNYGNGFNVSSEQSSWALMNFDTMIPAVVAQYQDAASKINECIDSANCYTAYKDGQNYVPHDVPAGMLSSWDSWENLPWDTDKRNSYDIEIATKAAYLMANIDTFDGMLVGDIGVRYVSTEETSGGYVGTSINDLTFKSVSRTYDNVLPSLNLNLALNEDMLVRFAAAKVMARPSFIDIALSERVSPAAGRFNSGNPDLDPFEATQLDLTWEWYYTEGSMMSLGLFYKDITSFNYKNTTATDPDSGEFVADPTGAPYLDDDGNYQAFLITRPTNGVGGEIAGLEVNYQQNFDFLPGFLSNTGISFNYTLTESDATYLKDTDGISSEYADVALPFLGQSEHSVNTQVYYETKKFSIRLAHNYRTEYLLTPTGSGGVDDTQTPANWVDAYGQLDLSASYNITPKISANFQAVNLTGSTPYAFQTRPSEGNVLDGNVPDNRLLYLRDVGTTVRAGIRVKF